MKWKDYTLKEIRQYSNEYKELTAANRSTMTKEQLIAILPGEGPAVPLHRDLIGGAKKKYSCRSPIEKDNCNYLNLCNYCKKPNCNCMYKPPIPGLVCINCRGVYCVCPREVYLKKKYIPPITDAAQQVLSTACTTSYYDQVPYHTATCTRQQCSDECKRFYLSPQMY